MRSGYGLGLRGQFHQSRDIHLGWWRTARQVPLNTCQSCLGVPLTPACDLNTAYSQLLGDSLVLHPLRGQQHDARTLRKPHAG
jgi:hypothetical protein